MQTCKSTCPMSFIRDCSSLLENSNTILSIYRREQPYYSNYWASNSSHHNRKMGAKSKRYHLLLRSEHLRIQSLISCSKVQVGRKFFLLLWCHGVILWLCSQNSPRVRSQVECHHLSVIKVFFISVVFKGLALKTATSSLPVKTEVFLSSCEKRMLQIRAKTELIHKLFLIGKCSSYPWDFHDFSTNIWTFMSPGDLELDGNTTEIFIKFEFYCLSKLQDCYKNGLNLC